MPSNTATDLAGLPTPLGHSGKALGCRKDGMPTIRSC